MSAPREWWIHENMKEVFNIPPWKCGREAEVVHVIERSAYSKAIEALKNIADQDYRGNRPNECVIAYEALKALGEL